VAAALAIFTPSIARAAQPPTEGTVAWFTFHAFAGRNPCLLVRELQHLHFGDSLTVFAIRSPARTRRVETLFDPAGPKRIFDTRGFQGVYHDRELWKTIGCFWSLGQPLPPVATELARLDESDTLDHAVLAIDGLPSRALRIGGQSTPLGASELRAIEQRFRSQLSKDFSQGKVLRAGRRYRTKSSGELIEMFLGKSFESPADSGPPIDSIRISRLFVRGERLIAVHTFSRASGVAEHVELEPPRLDETNWYVTSDQTLGFLSFDSGHSWFRLCVDTGFEGLDWRIWRLGDPSPTWSFYLDTPH